MHRSISLRIRHVAAAAGILSVGMLSWGIAQAAIGPNTPSSSAPAEVPASSAGMPPTAQAVADKKVQPILD